MNSTTIKNSNALWIAEDEISLKKNIKEELEIDPTQIRQAQAKEVLILKGALYPEAIPVLHKIPNIEKNGSRRLLLRIDNQNFAQF